MRTIRSVIVILIMIIIASCAEALLSPRSFQERRYRPCQNDEVTPATGRVCHRYCAKYKALHSDISENCKEWRVDIKDLTKEADFLEFRSAGFILIQEGRIK
jgi:hypothetical protein